MSDIWKANQVETWYQQLDLKSTNSLHDVATITFPTAFSSKACLFFSAFNSYLMDDVNEVFPQFFEIILKKNMN